MAVHPDVPGLYVGIDVNGEELPQYDETDEDERESNTIIKYVEAVSGAEFGISYRFDSSTFPFAQDCIRISIEFDGNKASRRYVRPGEIAESRRIVTTGSVYNTGNGWVKRPMLFAALTVNDGAADEKLLGKLGDLGRLRVRCYRCKLVSERKPEQVDHPIHAQPEALVADGKLSEKNLKGKALTHQATLGDPVAYNKAPSKNYKTLGAPFAIFEFRYRSRTALQAIGVTPRTPSPEPLARDPVNDMTLDEMREWIRRRKGTHAEPANNKQERKIKRERSNYDDEEDDGGDGIEIIEQRSKKVRVSEVIELSDDD